MFYNTINTNYLNHSKIKFMCADLSTATTIIAISASARGGITNHVFEMSSSGHFLFNRDFDLLGCCRLDWAAGEPGVWLLSAASEPRDELVEPLPDRDFGCPFPPCSTGGYLIYRLLPDATRTNLVCGYARFSLIPTFDLTIFKGFGRLLLYLSCLHLGRVVQSRTQR